MTRMPLISGFAFAAAIASAGPPVAPPVFSVHDLDRDGALSREEYAAVQAHCAKQRGDHCKTALLPFEALDADRDGRIGEAELVEKLGRRHRGGGRWTWDTLPSRQEATRP